MGQITGVCALIFGFSGILSLSFSSIIIHITHFVAFSAPLLNAFPVALTILFCFGSQVFEGISETNSRNQKGIIVTIFFLFHKARKYYRGGNHDFRRTYTHGSRSWLVVCMHGGCISGFHGMSGRKVTPRANGLGMGTAMGHGHGELKSIAHYHDNLRLINEQRQGMTKAGGHPTSFWGVPVPF